MTKQLTEKEMQITLKHKTRAMQKHTHIHCCWKRTMVRYLAAPNEVHKHPNSRNITLKPTGKNIQNTHTLSYSLQRYL